MEGQEATVLQLLPNSQPCRSSFGLADTARGKPRSRVMARPYGTLKLVMLPVLGSDPTDCPGHRAHDHRVGLNDLAPELHPAQHRAGGNPGCRKQTVTAHHVLDLIFLSGARDPH